MQILLSHCMNRVYYLSHVSVRSAYNHFQKLRSSAIREELLQNNQDITGGALMTAISAKVCIVLYFS